MTAYSFVYTKEGRQNTSSSHSTARLRKTPPPTASHHARGGSSASIRSRQTSTSSSTPKEPPSPNPTYVPTSYDEPSNPNGSVDAFYGKLIDSDGRPSDLYRRMSDTLFSYIDHNCEPAYLRGTQYLEPEKIKWYSVIAQGEKITDFQTYIDVGGLRSFYDIAAPSYHVFNTNGRPVPMLNKASFLQMNVYVARATPRDTCKAWANAISCFRLVDPTSGKHFPLPMPVRAFPQANDSMAAALRRANEELLVRMLEGVYARKMAGNAAFNRPSGNLGSRGGFNHQPPLSSAYAQPPLSPYMSAFDWNQYMLQIQHNALQQQTMYNQSYMNMLQAQSTGPDYGGMIMNIVSGLMGGGLGGGGSIATMLSYGAQMILGIGSF